jgi:hypothetical protein
LTSQTRILTFFSFSYFKDITIQFGYVIFILFVLNIIRNIAVIEVFDLEDVIFYFVEMFIPVVTYSNADTQKLNILLDNKNKSGIYR